MRCDMAERKLVILYLGHALLAIPTSKQIILEYRKKLKPWVHVEPL